ncbi:hypothetical protein AVEN_246632-1 [Araneus ventricosus]|uniref:Uncharacterized protein n=1 Tax=Araneus ventricosus TaxID=182803 RepID=A0A4Y2LKS5_ARAVE|nr:hypothetical protein AVEN_246632-1 [Araneus ventricosus]
MLHKTCKYVYRCSHRFRSCFSLVSLSMQTYACDVYVEGISLNASHKVFQKLEKLQFLLILVFIAINLIPVLKTSWDIKDI